MSYGPDEPYSLNAVSTTDLYDAAAVDVDERLDQDMTEDTSIKALRETDLGVVEDLAAWVDAR